MFCLTLTMRIVFLYPPLMMAWFEQLVEAICLLVPPAKAYIIFSWRTFARALAPLVACKRSIDYTNSLGSISSRILLIPPATAYYIRYRPGGLSCMLIYHPWY